MRAVHLRNRSFLHALTAAVVSDPEPSGLEGCVRVGIAHPTGDDWIELRFDGTGARVGPTTPEGADVTLLVGTYEARRIMAGRRLPHAPLFSLQGDASLYDRFVARYFADDGWVGLQRAEGRAKLSRAASTSGRAAHAAM